MIQLEKPRQSFTPLGEFWADYIRNQIISQNFTMDEDALKNYLQLLYGTLTTLEFNSLKSLPFEISCLDCKNNHKDRRDSVCKTHIGGIRGALEAILRVPLSIEYNPVTGAQCTLSIRLAKDENDVDYIPFAQRAEHLEVVPQQSDAHAYVLNKTDQQYYPVSNFHHTLLLHLDQPVSSTKLVRALNAPLEQVCTGLDELYQSGWINVNFAPANDG